MEPATYCGISENVRCVVVVSSDFLRLVFLRCVFVLVLCVPLPSLRASISDFGFRLDARLPPCPSWVGGTTGGERIVQCPMPYISHSGFVAGFFFARARVRMLGGPRSASGEFASTLSALFALAAAALCPNTSLTTGGTFVHPTALKVYSPAQVYGRQRRSDVVYGSPCIVDGRRQFGVRLSTSEIPNTKRMRLTLTLSRSSKSETSTSLRAAKWYYNLQHACTSRSPTGSRNCTDRIEADPTCRTDIGTSCGVV
ncbi:hypothetical protein B0H16DRAFT_150783 [Mycena metata]|uniref:Uncharacterized protein n=1 Tax=Mycena metata TaxID=1033252 RepID=A0AAD7MW85_9AGAR|nr:hypothetical protein B0H16DRAFT_150783 [Mycena metata]